jgi:ABC-type multidrug transport system fused ATPase/permease subunit
MDLWLAALIILGAAVASAAGMLVVRRRAPAGTYFRDVVPAGAVYTVVGTAYMVIVAFVFFVAFESYHAAKADAQDEATATLAMFHAAGPFGSTASARLQGQVLCYAREVISKEWPTMRQGETSPVVDARVTALEENAEHLPVNGAKQAAAYEHWFALNEDRRKGRQGRIAEASPLVPPLIWLILIIGAVVVIATVCFFADAEEARGPQGAMIAAVAAIVVSGLILVRFLDKPYENQSGSIRPTAMKRSLALMQGEQKRTGRAVIPCP